VRRFLLLLRCDIRGNTVACSGIRPVIAGSARKDVGVRRMHTLDGCCIGSSAVAANRGLPVVAAYVQVIV